MSKVIDFENKILEKEEPDFGALADLICGIQTPKAARALTAYNQVAEEGMKNRKKNRNGLKLIK